MSSESIVQSLLSSSLVKKKAGFVPSATTASKWQPSEGPINQPKWCPACGRWKPGNAPGVITFHVCNNRGDWRNDADVIVGEVIDESP